MSERPSVPERIWAIRTQQREAYDEADRSGGMADTRGLVLAINALTDAVLLLMSGDDR